MDITPRVRKRARGNSATAPPTPWFASSRRPTPTRWRQTETVILSGVERSEESNGVIAILRFAQDDISFYVGTQAERANSREHSDRLGRAPSSRRALHQPRCPR